MKKICCVTLLLLLVGLLFSGCESTPASNDTPVKQGSTSSVKTDDSIWYSEEADVRGRIWLGMTEKEVYDVLNQYNITIVKATHVLECDEYGAQYEPSECYYEKCLYTQGHQAFYFDEANRLMEICYHDQMHPSSAPVNEEFEAQRGVKRRDDYEDMINAYGEPNKVISVGSGIEESSHIYYLENGDYLHFVYQGASTPIQSIHYSKFPYAFSFS